MTSYSVIASFTIVPLARIRLYHTAAILSQETKKALFQHPKPRSHFHGCEAWGAETKLFLNSLLGQYGRRVIKANGL